MRRTITIEGLDEPDATIEGSDALMAAIDLRTQANHYRKLREVADNAKAWQTWDEAVGRCERVADALSGEIV